MGNISSVKQVF